MTVTELFKKWLIETKNKEYISDLSSNIDSDDSKTTCQKERKVPTNSLQIKPFYLTKRSSNSIENEIKDITIKFNNILSKYNNSSDDIKQNGLNKQQFELVTVNICGFSKYCNSLLFSKILSTNNNDDSDNNNNNNNLITLPTFISFFHKYFSDNEEISFRLVQILKQNDNNNYLIKEDFIPLIKEILFCHPGLEFLRESVEFHKFYVSTVICRIFYYLDTNKNNEISVRELRRSNFMDILLLLDEEFDINEIFDYFSYEHFYVIYTKFWELDQDENNLLTKDDLIKYNDYALTPKVVERIINGSSKKNKSKISEKNKTTMNYEEFVNFIISEEDKTSKTSLKYWFRILDLNDNGVLTEYELEIFYQQQSAKILTLCGETISFQNILILLNDMVSPKIDFQFTMNDIKKSKMGHFFFNSLINVHKFALNEQKDIELLNRIRNSPHMTDWDRFASKQYFILSNDQ